MKQKKLRSAFNTRQYMVSKDYEIYYYSDTRLAPVKSHSHDYYEFYLLVEGEVSIVIEKETLPLSSGDLIIVPPGIKHYPVIHNPEIPYRRFVFWVSEDYARTLMEESVDYVWLLQKAASQKQYRFHLGFNEFNNIQYRILSLLEEVHSARFGREAAMRNQVNNLILHLNRVVYEAEHPEVSGNGSDLMSDLLQYISSHLCENLELETLADRFFVSKYYISHLFKDTLGISLHQYIQKKRLSAARDALLSGEKAGKLYSDYGFNDYSVFFRAFCKEYGLSPKEYQYVYLKDPERMKE